MMLVARFFFGPRSSAGDFLGDETSMKQSNMANNMTINMAIYDKPKNDINFYINSIYIILIRQR
jgi:hypothetical protein